MAVNLDVNPDISFKKVFESGSTKELKLITKNEYRAALSKFLPESYSAPDKRHILHYFLLMSIYLVGMFSIVTIASLPLKIVISAVMGIALTGLTFFLHDVMHGSIIKSQSISYLFGLSVGVLNLFAPLFWKRVHNLHHARTGNIDDPDRSYVLHEKPTTPISKFVYRMRISDESIHPFISMVFMSLGFFFYFFNTMFYGLIASKASVQKDKKYQRIQEIFKKKRDRLIVGGELILILAFQTFLFTVVCQNNVLNYLLASLIPVGIAHIIAMSYIHTNHFLSPLTGDVDDPLVNSLSLKNSWIVDKVFSNFSHHVEHHLFPAMSSYHYPKVRELLLKHYPGRFKLIPMIDAMKMLFDTPRIYDDYTHLTNVAGTKKFDCLMPTNT